jgi:hypothetical protein
MCDNVGHPEVTMRVVSRAIGLLSVAIALVSGLGACGSSSKSSGATAPSTTMQTTTGSNTGQDVAADKAAAAAAALKLSDLPAGWTSTPAQTAGSDAINTQLAQCMGVSAADLNTQGPTDYSTPDFADPGGTNTISGSVGYTPSKANAQRTFAIYADAKAPACLSSTIKTVFDEQIRHPSKTASSLPLGVTVGTPSTAKVTFPVTGDQTVAYRITLPVNAQGLTLSVYIDFVIATKGRARVEGDFENVGTPLATAQEQHYMGLVVDRLTNT